MQFFCFVNNYFVYESYCVNVILEYGDQEEMR